MSRPLMDLTDVTYDKAGYALLSHQSALIARGMPPSCTTAEAADTCYASRGLDKVSVPVDGLRVIETKTTAVVDESLLKSIGRTNMRSSLFKYCQNTYEALKSMSSHRSECSNSVGCKCRQHCPSLNPAIPATREIISKGCHFLGDIGTTKNSPEWMKSYSAGRHTSFAMSSASQECLESKNSQTTRNLLITESTGVGPSKEDAYIRSEIHETVNRDLHLLLPFFYLGERQVKLHPHSTSVHLGDFSESKDIVKHDTSAAMDEDSFEEKNFGKSLHSGSCSAKSPKAHVLETNLATQMLSDINFENPALPDTSNTHSLGMDDCLIADPGSRWIKRLKLSASNCAQTTKSSSMAETLPHKKVNRSYNRGSIAPLVSDIGGNSSKNEDKNLLLSHCWIQRWLCNRSILTKKEVVCESQCSKSAPGTLQKQHFPSVEAMALVVKAMTGFQQPDVYKSSSYTVWKTKAF